MSDLDTPITGRDTRVIVTVDGVLKRVQDQVTNFSHRTVQDEIQTKVLGGDGSLIDKTFSHHEGTIEFACSRAELDEIEDIVLEARRKRIPVVINIKTTEHYRDGSSKTYTYRDVKLDFEFNTARAQAKSFTLNWKSGVHRLAA